MRQGLLVGTNNFYLMTLTLEFDLVLFENFNLANYFWKVSVRALIFHMNILWDKALLEPTILTRALIFYMNIHCDKIFVLVLNLLTFTFDQFKKKNISHNFFKIVYWSFHIANDKIFRLVSKYISLWSWPSLELASIGVLCFINTSCLK